MQAWMNSVWSISVAAGGVIAAVVVFLNHVLTVRRLRLELATLEKQLKEQERRILVPTREDVERYNHILSRLQDTLTRDREAFHWITDLEDHRFRLQQEIVSRERRLLTEQPGLAELNSNVETLNGAVQHMTAALEELSERLRAGVTSTGDSDALCTAPPPSR